MGIGTVLFIVAVIAGAAAMAWLYVTYEKPQQVQAEASFHTTNVTLRFLEASGQQVALEYLLVVNGVVQKTGRATEAGYVVEALLQNDSVQLLSVNGSSARFYSSFRSLPRLEPGVQRQDILLTSWGNLSLSHEGTFGVDNTLFLHLKANGSLQNVSACLTWDQSVAIAGLQGYERIDKPSRLANTVDRCFHLTDLTPSNRDLVLNLTYLKAQDFIGNEILKITIIDQDLMWNGSSVVSSYGLQDIASPDVVYTIR